MRVRLSVRLAALGGAIALGAAGIASASPFAAGRLLVQSLALPFGLLPGDLAAQDLPLSLEFARIAAPLALIWVVAGLLRHILGNGFVLARIRARGEHLVVAGHDVLAQSIVSTQLAQGRPVVILGQRNDAEWIGPAMRQGAAVCAEVSKCGLESARALVLTAPDDRANLLQAREIIAGLDLGRPAGNPLEVIASLSSEDALPPGAGDALLGAQGRLRPACLPNMVARHLFLDHSLDAFTWHAEQDSTVFIVGLTEITRAYIAYMLTGVHWRNGKKARLVVLDTDPSAARAAIGRRHGNIDALSPIAYVAWDGKATGFDSLIADLQESYGRPAAYVIDAGADALQQDLARRIVSLHAAADLPLPPVYARLDDEPSIVLPDGLRPFGFPEVLRDPDALLQEDHDVLARAIHDLYLEGRLGDGERIGARESLREWEDLPERYRADNRMVADCYQLKLRDIGCRTVLRTNGQTAGFRLREAEVEDLARAEHDRWMVAKLADGWRHGPVRDDPAKLHPDIVPYDDLSEAIKDLDREQVRVIARIMARQNRSVVRLLEVAMVLRDAPCPPLAALMASLREHYPDRLPRFAAVGRAADAIAALQGEGALINVIASSFGVSPFAYDAVTAVPAGEEFAALAQNASLCVLCGDGAAADGLPFIRLSREGIVVEAPWLS